MRSRDRFSLWAGVFILVGLVVMAQALAGEKPATEPGERYPFDPVCPWGRIADGHGMLIRCLAPREASLLLNGVAGDGAAPVPSGGEPAKDMAALPVAFKGVGPVKADTGELPLAERKLAAAADRYVACAEKHGGLSATEAKVVVRFLVRERGRAEGVAVKSHEGVSKAAATCIADVVDRRYVGYPAAPIVGAEMPIELKQKR